MRFTNRKGIGSEHAIQEEIRKRLEAGGWDTFKMHGSAYQKGFPDTFCCHPIYGSIWIEYKKPGEKLSFVQQQTFSRMHKGKVKIFVLESVVGWEKIIQGPANWLSYIRG